MPRPGVSVDQQRVVGLARRLGHGDRGGVGEPVRRSDDEGLEDVLGVEPGLQHAAARLPGRVRAERRRHVEGICRQVDLWIDRQVVMSARVVDLRGRRTTALAGGTERGPLQLGVDRHRDPDLGAEGVAQGVLEPRAEPALELVAGEVVGHRDDRGVLMQGDRAARGEPGPLARGQVVDQVAPHRVEVGTLGGRGGVVLGAVRAVVHAGSSVPGQFFRHDEADPEGFPSPSPLPGEVGGVSR